MNIPQAMDENLNMHRSAGLEGVDLSQFQGDISKLNTNVLRGIEYITIPRSTDQEYIDHTLLSPEYIAAHIQNGLVVDIIQSQQSEQQDSISSHNNIYSNNEQVQKSPEPTALVAHRNFMQTHDRSTLSFAQIISDSNQINRNQITPTNDHLHSENDLRIDSNQRIDNVSRTVIIGEQDRQFLQFLPKSMPPLLNNGAPVIVSNKEAATIASVNDIDLANNFVETFNQMGQSVLQDIVKSTNSNVSNQQHQQMPIKNQNNDLSSLPPLPPLTPISKLQINRKTSEDHHTMQFKGIPALDSLNIQRNEAILKNRCFFSDEDELNLMQTNMNFTRQISKDVHLVGAPKKNLPHKKRITKKLKNINASEEHVQLSERLSYQVQTNHLNQHNFGQCQQQHQQQSVTLNLTINQQPIQLANTTTRSSTHKETINQQLLNTNPFPNQAITTSTERPVTANLIPQEQLAQPIIVSNFSCELCGAQIESQLEFFNHLKMHYEPQTPMQSNNLKVVNLQTDISNLNSASSDNSPVILQQRNAQNIFQIGNQQKNCEPCISNQSIPDELVMNQNFVDLQNSSQDLRCISGIKADDASDDCDITMNDYNSADAINGIKSEAEHNEFSDTEDMIESGVLDKVQNAVDNYIENSANDVKHFISLNSDQNSGDLVDGSCVAKDWYQNDPNAFTNSIVYEMTKSGADNASGLDVQHFQMSDGINQQHQQMHGHATMNSTVIERIPATSTTEELTLIYEINVNDKDFTIIDENSTECILRRQLLRSEHDGNSSDLVNSNDFDQIENLSTNIKDYSSDKNIVEMAVTSPLLIRNSIQDEFVEEEKTDSDVDALKPDTVRKKKKIFRCKRCDKLCNSKNALHYHFLSHTGERPHQCEVCGKSFFASSALKVHKRLHSGDKPYECSFCNRPFRQWGDLKYHIQSRHTKEKSHQCEFCGKDFARRYSLVIHRRIHTGEKNYKCEFCDKEFRASSYLQVHRKIHTGEKPFVCDVCGKKFRVRGDLKRHSNIHERYKPSEVKIDEMSSISASSNKDLFSLDDANTLQSRSTDMLDQIAIESDDSVFAEKYKIPENSNQKSKKRNFSNLQLEKPKKSKLKCEIKCSDASTDRKGIINYSIENSTNKSMFAGTASDIRDEAV